MESHKKRFFLVDNVKMHPILVSVSKIDDREKKEGGREEKLQFLHLGWHKKRKITGRYRIFLDLLS